MQTTSLRSTALPAALTALAALLPGCSAPEEAPRTARAEASAEAPAVEPRPWEHERSDLAVDPRLHFGALDNGVRWAWAEASEPKERCYVRMHVDVGSFAERDDEQGMAHFLEHMAFNGSRRFAPGTLVEWFQEHGMDFGPDLNAYTYFGETVYQLDLPDSGEETLREGLAILRDWADGMLLEEDEVQAEKGVIDGEQRERDSAGYRVQLRIFEEQYEGTRVAERIPIGVREVREAFTAEGVRGFYERWYRPENLTVAVVGDLRGLDPAPLIAAAFEGFEVPAAPLPSEPGPGAPVLEERFFVVHEPEIPSVSITIERLKAWEQEPDTAETRTDDLDLACARRMLNLRYGELAKQEGAAFLYARTTPAGGLEVYEGESLELGSKPEQWREALAAVEIELRRALEFGFQQAELDEVRADWLRSLDEAVKREGTRDSRGVMNGILRAAEHRYVPTAAVTDRDTIAPVLSALDLEQCDRAFREAWSEGVLNVFATGALEVEADELRAAYEQARQREVEAGAAIATIGFAYASDPDAGDVGGEVAERRHVEDLDVWLVEFANGARLNVKQTDFKEREILLQARVAEGLLTLAPDDYALGWVGSQAFGMGGLGAHSEDDLRRLSAGKVAGLGFEMGQDAFVLSGPTTSEDLLFQLELLSAYLRDPGWRDDGLRVIEERVPLLFEQLAHVPQGPMMLEFLPAVFSGDRRLVELPRRERIAEVELPAIRAWLEPLLADGPLEVTVVGDVDVDQVVEACARTIGALPERRERRPYTDRLEAGPVATGVELRRTVETEIDKALVMLCFPCGDGLETARRRELQFLGRVIADRLRVKVREELGASYSPVAQASPDRVFPSIGLISIVASTDPAEVGVLVDACYEVAADLADNGVTEEEVARLKEPLLAQVRDALRTNAFWLGSLADIQQRPQTLDDIRSYSGFYQTISTEALSRHAATSLGRQQASLLVVDPAE